MRKVKLSIVRYSLLVVSLLYVILCRFNPSWAEMYALQVYPKVSRVLSFISFLFPFSLEEVLVVAVLLWIIFFPVWMRRRQKRWRAILGREAEVLIWFYVWFYIGWGLNYFHEDIYKRSYLAHAPYEEEIFTCFLDEYKDSLNRFYTSSTELDTKKMNFDFMFFYYSLPKSFGLAKPLVTYRVKSFTFTPLYSGVGVLGSMGPFFAEAQLNADLLPQQYPFTYAHEYSHLLGVSSEAEANFWAYSACRSSSLPLVKYSGYFGLLPYVLSNASTLLPKEKFDEWVAQIRPEVLEDYKRKSIYWREKYSPLIGAVQDYVYDLFLKGNNISSGKKNYAEVVEIIIARYYQPRFCGMLFWADDTDKER